ncbi:amino acid adenylation domain-containing protein [Streptomyces cyaneogriseus]|uniref:amino acid adenylation domain-containing protein n=1 Tax=Streptomyces cyaneogriseus TaxID=68192 RepID=UPI00069927D8|nr:amino acid adenylation domain-containing protein [Streptomyces cyaneogriseus]
MTGPDARTSTTGTLHGIFERRAALAGHRAALTDGPRTLTYAELNRAANRLAHALLRGGAGPGTFVGVCADRSADLVVAILAVLKCGAAYVPLDPSYPLERRRFTLDDTGCGVIVGQERHRTAFPGTAYLSVEDSAGESDTDPRPGVTARHPAYVIHTSGSTGTPKGVVVTHANVVRLFDACRDELGIAAADSDDVWTLFHSCAFDFSVWELWGALLHGGRLVVVPYTTSRSPESFLRLLRGERVTVLSQTPTAFRQLVRAAERAAFPDTALRLTVFGGEALDPAALRPWTERYGTDRPRLVNMYGITETTVHVTLRTLTAGDCATARSPIGRPLPGVRVHLLDAAGDPVAPGEQGEMYVGGTGVALGYLDRPALTAERFVPDPFGGPGERLYRSGDLAVLTEDGELEFRGRADDQVQLRGFRVELGEIEAALGALEGVREAAVTLRTDAVGEAVLAGYAVLAPAATATADDLRRGLAERLPAHMVPSALVLLDSFPLTPNGKLDRKALPAPPGPAPADVPPPGTDGPAPVEELLARIWSRALGRARVEPGENFFALGGDSLTALRVVGLAREAGIDVKVEHLLQYPTVATLAPHATVVPAEDTAPAADAPRAVHDGEPLPPDVTTACPLTSLQLGMIFESQLSGDPTLYHDLVSVRLHGPLVPDALRRALRTLAARHDVLRTTFDLGTYAEPLQLVHDRPAVPLHHGEDLPAAATAAEAVRAWWREQWQRPFTLEGKPLWRCHAHDHHDGTFQLSVSAHHSILDGWSFALLVTELIGTYERALGRAPAPPAPPALPYHAYVALERADSRCDAAREHWARVVRDARATPLPPPGAPGTAALDPDARLPLPADLADAVRGLADRLGVPAKSVYLAAHLRALRAATGDPRPVTGVVTGGRPEAAGGEEALGLFLNSVPLRAAPAGGTWADLVRSVFAEERASAPFRRFPLAEIQALAGGAPFSVLFNYTDFRPFDTLADLRALRVVDWWFCDRTSFPVVVEVGRQPMDKNWELTVRVDPARTTSAFGAGLARHFLDGLRRMCEDPFDDC